MILISTCTHVESIHARKLDPSYLLQEEYNIQIEYYIKNKCYLIISLIIGPINLLQY